MGNKYFHDDFDKKLRMLGEASSLGEAIRNYEEIYRLINHRGKSEETEKVKEDIISVAGLLQKIIDSKKKELEELDQELGDFDIGRGDLFG